MIAPERGDLMTTRHNGSKRSGMSLMEVIVALAVFLSALIVLGRLVVLGGEQAREVQELARATQLCQSKLAEVVAGVVPLQSQPDVPFDEEPSWNWSLDCSQGEIAGLWDVTVKVDHERGDGTHAECTFMQKVLDPSLRGHAADGAMAAAAAAAALAANSSSNSNSSTPAGGAMITPSSIAAAAVSAGGAPVGKGKGQGKGQGQGKGKGGGQGKGNGGGQGQGKAGQGKGGGQGPGGQGKGGGGGRGGARLRRRCLRPRGMPGCTHP